MSAKLRPKKKREKASDPENRLEGRSVPSCESSSFVGFLCRQAPAIHKVFVVVIHPQQGSSRLVEKKRRRR